MADPDPLAARLAGLAVDPPAGLLDRLVTRWVRVPGPGADLYVAYTDRGIAYLCPAEAVGDRPQAFADLFHQRFARPMLPAERPPAGLLPALRTGRTAGLRFDLSGSSDFERSVLEVTATIPRGEVRPYAWVARAVARPRAVRAVGSALARNPVPILIPCHRVIRSDGRTGDYAFGPATKQRLLEMEGVDLQGLVELARRGIRYLGSDSTGVVCFPSCTNARRISPRHRRGFRTIAEATAAGYRPCRRCRPAA